MKRLLIYMFILMVGASNAAETPEVVADYNRSSLYTLSLLHSGTTMYSEIFQTVLKLECPDRYNDHSLSLRTINAFGKPDEKEQLRQLEDFIKRNKIAKRMVAKWFDRDKEDGTFNMELIKERGNYNATIEDMNVAMQTTRGKAMLEDAGEQLISNTFLVVNDVTYVNKQSRAEAWQAAFELATMVATLGASAGGKDAKKTSESVAGVGVLGNTITSLIAGFGVNIRSYLFRLTWNDDIAGQFYSQYYYDKNNVSTDKKKAFDLDDNLFKLEYVGSFESSSSKTVTRGLHKDEEVFKKVLTRAFDENIVQLRKKFEVFKITAPIYQIDGEEIRIHIGKKEGITSGSRFEVLERMEDADGKLSYKRRGVIKPQNKIWDNRFMATEEGAENATLGFTTFEKVSGGDFYPGMLIREIK